MEVIILLLFLLACGIGFYNLLLAVVIIGTAALVISTGAWVYLIAGLAIYALFRLG